MRPELFVGTRFVCPELFVGVRHRLAGSFAFCLSPFAPPHSSLATSHLPPTSSFPIRNTHNDAPTQRANARHTGLPRRSLAGKQNPKPPPVLSFINFGTGQTYDYG